MLSTFADFDLSSWYNSLGIIPGSVLSVVNRDKLLNELGIKSYLSTNPCSFASQTFNPANSKGWKNGKYCCCWSEIKIRNATIGSEIDIAVTWGFNESPTMWTLTFVDCKKDLTSLLPVLPSNVRCNIPSFCTGVTCCIEETNVLRTGITVGVELDDCSHVLTFQVEQLKIRIQLHDYSFGKNFKCLHLHFNHTFKTVRALDLAFVSLRNWFNINVYLFYWIST